MLIESKSNLARLMATENLVVEQKNVSTASFDIKNRVLTVPILSGKLSPELYDLFLGHEVGHALETPEAGWHTSITDLKVNRSILNVCEDVRIEKKIKRRYPGLKVSFLKGYNELMKMDFFGVKDMNLAKMNYIDRLNIHTKCGARVSLDFHGFEEELLQEVESAETFEETVEVAKKIQAYMKEEQEKKKNSSADTSEIDEGEDSGEAKSFVTMPGDGDDSNDDPDESADSGDAAPVEESTEDSDEDGEAPGTSGEGSYEDGVMESKTDNFFREKEEELYENTKNVEYVYSNIPDLNLENIIVPYARIMKDIQEENMLYPDFYKPDVLKANFNKFRIESNKVVSYLCKEFELRKNADQMSRAKVSKTGELNMNKIHEYKITDDIFARMTTVPNGKSHGLVMFIDWSGSMIDHIHSTVKQLLNLTMFCKKVNIPFEVYGFTTFSPFSDPADYSYRHYSQPKYQKPVIGDLAVSQFSLLNLLSSKMSTTEYSKMCSILLDYGRPEQQSSKHYTNICIPEVYLLSGTPLNEAIIAAFKIVPKFKADNKLQVVNTVFLTDGEGSSLPGRISNIDEKTGRHVIGGSIYANSRQKSILRDPITKATVEIASRRGAYGHSPQSISESIALLNLFKQRVDSNLIGFFIASSRNIKSSLQQYCSNMEESYSLSEQFKKKGFCVLNGSGYDDYYFIRSSELDIDEDAEFEVKSNTTRGLVSAFSKYNGNKISNRIVLNRFITLIA
jgi:hypothetical protein